LRGCDVFGGHGEVALVLAALVVHDHDELAGVDGGDGLGCGSKFDIKRGCAHGVNCRLHHTRGRRLATSRRCVVLAFVPAPFLPFFLFRRHFGQFSSRTTMFSFCLGSAEGSGRWEFIVAGGNAMGAKLGALQGQREAGGGGLVRWWKDFVFLDLFLEKNKSNMPSFNENSTS
jgi:hypothetical protein